MKFAKKHFILLYFAFSFCFLTCALQLFAAEELSSIAAIVGREVITTAELDEQLQFLILSGFIQAEESLSIDSLKLDLLHELINKRILIEYAQKESIEVMPDEIEEMLENTIADIKSRFPDEEFFLMKLQEEGLSLEMFKENYRKQITESLLLQKLMQKAFGSEMFVTQKEIEDFYTTNRDSFAEPAKIEFSHILIIPRPSHTEEKRVQSKINEVLLRLEFNEDFGKLARKYSAGEFRNKGGDLGFVRKEDLSPEIADAAFSLSVNELTLARALDGFHLLKCVGKKDSLCHLKRIFFKVRITSLDTLRAQKRASEIKKRADNGEDFSKLVKKYSDDVETNTIDGDLGEVYIDQLQPLFRDAVIDLDVGEISEPVKTEFGFHIFRINSKPEPEIPELEEIKNIVKEFIIQKRTREKTEELLERILPDFYVKNFLKNKQNQ